MLLSAVGRNAPLLLQSNDRFEPLNTNRRSSISDDTASGFTISSDGPDVAISLWWKEISCEVQPSYQLTICKVEAQCIVKTTDVAKFTLRNSPDMPVFFWNDYHVTVNATCGENSVRLQEFYPSPGPGGKAPEGILSGRVYRDRKNIQTKLMSSAYSRIAPLEWLQ